MRDTEERDRIREQYAGRPGVGHHVERLSGELENAEAYGDEGRAESLRAELAGHGYKGPAERSREEAAQARREAAAAKKADSGQARSELPKDRAETPRQTAESRKPVK